MKIRKISALLLALAMCFALCACGSSAKYASDSASAAYYNSYAEMAMEAPMEAAALYDYDEAGFSASTAAGAPVPEPEESDAPDGNPEKIIYSADVTVETTDFDNSIAALNALVSSYGGYVQSSSVNGANYYNYSRGYRIDRSASYVIRIPSARFSELMNNISVLGNVPYSYTYTENVTSQYYDVEARLKAYETQEEALLAMMAKAETVTDALAIQAQLSDIRYNIESLQSTLNNWDRRVSYSTVSISIDEVSEYTPDEEPGYGERLATAFKSGIEDFCEFFKDLLVGIAGSLPVLIILAVIVIIIVRAVKKNKNKPRKEKKNAKKENEAAPATVSPWPTAPEQENPENKE